MRQDSAVRAHHSRRGVFFSEQAVDFAVMETGLGGRFDTVSAVEKLILSSITSIGFDHMHMLGNSLEQIAYEKCGIMRTGVPCVIPSKQRRIFGYIFFGGFAELQANRCSHLHGYG